MNFIKPAFLMLGIISFSAVAAPAVMKCKIIPAYEYWPELIPEITKVCDDPGTSLEACNAFSVHAVGEQRKYAYTSQQSGIKKENGVLEFKPVGISSYEEKVKDGMVRRWVVYLIDNSGSVSNAQERFIVLDGLFKPITRLMNYADKMKYIDKVKRGTDLIDEDMKCSVGKGK